MEFPLVSEIQPIAPSGEVCIRCPSFVHGPPHPKRLEMLALPPSSHQSKCNMQIVVGLGQQGEQDLRTAMYKLRGQQKRKRTEFVL